MEIWFDSGSPTLFFPTLKAGVQDWLGELVRLYIADLDNRPERSQNRGLNR
jgi:hypothetical protein